MKKKRLFIFGERRGTEVRGLMRPAFSTAYRLSQLTANTAYYRLMTANLALSQEKKIVYFFTDLVPWWLKIRKHCKGRQR
jgi:hypothetical protein